jgi:hypothetical protein
MLKTEAIKTFLTNRTHEDLASLYHHGMEVQVNVAADGGTRHQMESGFRGKKWLAYSDAEGATWSSFRIPHNASTDPVYDDSPISFNLAKHVESIGMTGWNWVDKCSCWVAYDFDAIMGHSPAHTVKLSPDELSRVEKLAGELPYVTIRKSTSGSGLHLYVFLDPVIPTSNHNEHSALARAILAQMSLDVEFDFSNSVDTCGGNMWVWHRKQEAPDCGGLDLIKQGIPLDTVPKNWEVHLDVIEHRKRKASITVFDDKNEQDSYNDFAEQHPHTKIDQEHKQLIRKLESYSDWETYWEPEYNRLVTHTLALKKAHQELNIYGIFETSSSGSTTKNCYCFPRPRGSWAVFRFGKGCSEDPTWARDADANTHCFFNRPPTIRSASCFFDGVENLKGAYEFNKSKEAKDALKKLGLEIEIPPYLEDKPAQLKELPDGRVVFEIDAKGVMANSDMKGWLISNNKVSRIFEKPVSRTSEEENAVTEYDQMLRLTVNTDGSEMGYHYLPPGHSKWLILTKETIKDALAQRGFSTNETRPLFGTCANNPWTVVNKPFQGEYPGNRQWNYEAASLAFPLKPSTDNLYFPTWMKILSHVGKNLTREVKEDAWCQENGILSGGDFLKVWCAIMFQNPYIRLPYLFFYSPIQHTGKSTFPESLAMLMNRGYVKADMALSQQFNGELRAAVLCSIEEMNLTLNKDAYNKVKDYVTAENLSIRAMYTPQGHCINTTHWIQTANHLHFLPIEPQDTRIIVCLVDEIDRTDMLTSVELKTKLRKEAPDFLTELMSIELPPPPPGRMGMPVIRTEEKMRAEKNKESRLESFLRESTYPVDGAILTVEEFNDAFIASLDPSERMNWPKSRISREMPLERFPKGKSSSFSNRMCYGNLSFTPHTKPVGPRLEMRRDRLMVRVD